MYYEPLDSAQDAAKLLNDVRDTNLLGAIGDGPLHELLVDYFGDAGQTDSEPDDSGSDSEDVNFIDHVDETGPSLPLGDYANDNDAENLAADSDMSDDGHSDAGEDNPRPNHELNIDVAAEAVKTI
jgi:hypothetical protein